MFFNLIRSLFSGPVATDNPWQAATLEWQTTSPPPTENFEEIPEVTKGPYQYRVKSATEHEHETRSDAYSHNATMKSHVRSLKIDLFKVLSYRLILFGFLRVSVPPWQTYKC